jgi:DNA-3-methyladenine glycosylase II
MRRIETAADIEKGLRALAAADPRLEAVIATAGPVPLRRREPGFEGLARIIVAQQISVTAAAAIWGRFAATVDPVAPEGLLAATPEALRAAGLSAGKVRTLTAIAEAVRDGSVDLDAVALMAPEDAHAAMTRIHGVGPWTADIFLLFCAGHPDVWPGGDLALQHAVRMAFGLEGRPAEKACRGLAACWAPWRGVAARLFWAYYAAAKDGRDALPA